ncbi:MAG: hypothetical protein LBN06_01315 [Prevotellaceae bacterium]|jgi:hypothetical protein|nr:hypothetical protein [Prevotellaceae bacterium]
MKKEEELITEFKVYLVETGYSEYTPSHYPSTAYDYCKRVERVCLREGISVTRLYNSEILSIVAKYDIYGSEAEFGAKSHRAYINALKRFLSFKEFNDGKRMDPQ